MVRASGSYPEGHKFESHRRYQTIHDLFVLYSAETRGKWPVGQAVKTPPFHGGNMGSSPVRVTSKKHRNYPVLFCCMFPVRWAFEPIGFGKMRASIRETFFFERSESPRTGHHQQPKSNPSIRGWTVWVVSFSKILFKAFPFAVGTLFFLP